jgi:hypothetical protein
VTGARQVGKSTLARQVLDQVGGTYLTLDEPVSVPDAQTLAATDPWQVQWWALGLVGARPTEQKKGADKGVDVHLSFHDEAGAQTKQAILSVKAGYMSSPHVRDLHGVVEREGAAIGVLITMQEATSHMRTEAAAAGFYDSPWGGSYPHILSCRWESEGTGLTRAPALVFVVSK